MSGPLQFYFLFIFIFYFYFFLIFLFLFLFIYFFWLAAMGHHTALSLCDWISEHQKASYFFKTFFFLKVYQNVYVKPQPNKGGNSNF